MLVRRSGPVFGPTALFALSSLLTGNAFGAEEHPDRRIDPLLRHEMQARSEGRPGILADETTRYPCWVRIDPGTPLPADLQLTQHGEEVASGRLRIRDIEMLARWTGVRTIEAARRARPYLDTSVPEIGADQVHDGSGIPPVYGGQTGAGVVLGIVDTGIDVEHEDFIVASSTRILSLWDQTSASIDPPSGFGYGREWSPAEIDAGSVTEIDSDGHGTHVASTAAGNGAATGNGEPAYQYVGVAPEAKLVIVKTDFYTSSIVDAVDYVFERAEALGLPAVVNLSLGHQYGPHDGTETTDLAMDALVGPGRIVVAAAGNEQADGIHAEAAVERGSSEEIRLQIHPYVPQPGTDNDIVLIDGYYSQTEDVEITIFTPNGHSVGPVSPSGSVEIATPDGTVAVENDVFDPATADHNLHIKIWDDAVLTAPETGSWRILIENTTTAPGSSEAQTDFWIYYQSISQNDPPAFDPAWGMTASKLVGSPATADSVIAVGAYVTRTSWRSVDGNMYSYNPTPTLGAIAGFSSNGPRRDGVIKPDIAAPGQGIGAALSSDHATSDAWVLEDGAHFVTQGTSMACPHVAGVVALMLDAFGPLTRSEIMEKLTQTARSDGFTGALPNAAFGVGKIDAGATLLQPTPVLLLGLDMSRESDGVHLAWSVPDALSSIRFLVARTGAETGTAARPEPQVIAGDGTRVELGVTGTGPYYEFVDSDAPLESECYYWLTALQDPDIVLGPFAAPDAILPTGLVLSRPTPNPFSSRVSWNLTLPAAGPVSLDLVDAAGRRVVRLADGVLPAGTSAYTWSGRSESGESVSSGVYFLRARWNGLEQTERVLLVR